MLTISRLPVSGQRYPDVTLRNVMSIVRRRLPSPTDVQFETVRSVEACYVGCPEEFHLAVCVWNFFKRLKKVDWASVYKNSSLTGGTRNCIFRSERERERQRHFLPDFLSDEHFAFRFV